ncbi:amino acid transporter ANT1 isoform X3 [Elaeis guineensis]|uniref:Amino acid transporter ANT1 isoform X2 n=1 Tax=Elaeis guineensis var. tenera TaxID=51953 RepID=A0A6I9RJP1_ELAGV|nr:amino acid transporter ANT1 isoform X2 [Elaeis guineensis]
MAGTRGTGNGRWRCHVGADPGEHRGLHRRHRSARPPLRLPRRRLARRLPWRRCCRTCQLLLYASPWSKKVRPGKRQTESLRTISKGLVCKVQCRHKLEEDEEEIDEPSQIQTYGDLGEKAFGSIGRCLTELLILVAQTGGSVAYLVFIGQNLSSVFSSTKTKDYLVSPSVFIFLVLLPVEIALSFIRSLASLAPFSAFADACNVLAMAIVIKEDFPLFNNPFKTRNAFNGALGLPFAAGVAVFCFEGFSMTLALERSMAERKKFQWVLCQAFLVISLVYICFGIFGYFAYGDETKDIITLNLPNNLSSIAVKVGLCIALAFTFPMMMHPIHEILEAKLKSSRWFQKACNKVQVAERLGLHGIRILAVVALAVLASFIPGFGSFISFVGSTLCALLSFVLPASFHLTFLGSSMALWQRMLDYCILLVGLVFAVYGTYDAISGHSISS